MKTEMLFEKSLTEEIEEIETAIKEAEEDPQDKQKAQRALRKIRALTSRFHMTRTKMDEIEKKLSEATDGGTFEDIAKLTDAAMTIISVINRTYTQIKRIQSGKKAIGNHPERRRR